MSNDALADLLSDLGPFDLSEILRDAEPPDWQFTAEDMAILNALSEPRKVRKPRQRRPRAAPRPLYPTEPYADMAISAEARTARSDITCVC